jgi:hypothetical protein
VRAIAPAGFRLLEPSKELRRATRRRAVFAP